MSHCFYERLRVDRNATLDEIKLAFKRRALQVHPDKGGSKEAFHLVYEALETLADPEARKKYDHGQATAKSGPRQKPTKKECHSASRKACHKPPNSNKSRFDKGNAGTEPDTGHTPLSKQTKLLMKIRDLLKQLPRDLRNEVFTTEFSQKQRLLLEKWMVENPFKTQSGPKACLLALGAAKSVPQKEATGTERLQACDHSTALVCVDPKPTTGEGRLESVRPKAKSKRKESKKKMRRGQGSVVRSFYSDNYRADICFDALHVYTRSTDFQTAVDYLVVLTFVKQKMLDDTSKSCSFEDRFRETLTSCAGEHGIDAAELDLRYCVFQACRFFVGPRLKVRSPRVRNINVLAKMRRCLEPFRQYSLNLGAKSLLWHYTPAHLQDAWERYQAALAEAWEIAHADSTKFLETIRGHYEAQAYLRQRHLLRWERQHMGAEDKNQYRPKRLQERSSGRRECRERKQMAMHDKCLHQPRKIQKRQVSREGPSGKLSALKVLLGRWKQMLKREAQLRQKEHRQVLKQQKKDQQDQKRSQFVTKKRMRDQERLRREAHRKRMKFAHFMEDIPWI